MGIDTDTLGSDTTILLKPLAELLSFPTEEASHERQTTVFVLPIGLTQVRKRIELPTVRKAQDHLFHEFNPWSKSFLGIRLLVINIDHFGAPFNDPIHACLNESGDLERIQRSGATLTTLVLSDVTGASRAASKAVRGFFASWSTLPLIPSIPHSSG
jgi:hypothetical protein